MPACATISRCRGTARAGLQTAARPHIVITAATMRMTHLLVLMPREEDTRLHMRTRQRLVRVTVARSEIARSPGRLRRGADQQVFHGGLDRDRVLVVERHPGAASLGITANAACERQIEPHRTPHIVFGFAPGRAVHVHGCPRQSSDVTRTNWWLLLAYR